MVVAAALIALDLGPLRALFLRSDPTLRGSFTLLHARVLLSPAAHLALIALAATLMRAHAPLQGGARIAAFAAFAALSIEIAALLPCTFAGDALCGVFYVFVAPFTAIAMLAAFAVFVAASGSRALELPLRDRRARRRSVVMRSDHGALSRHDAQSRL
jgi:hypothetical protein